LAFELFIVLLFCLTFALHVIVFARCKYFALLNRILLCYFQLLGPVSVTLGLG